MLALSSVYYPPSLKYWEKRTLISSASPFSLPTKSAHYLLFSKLMMFPFKVNGRGLLRPLIPHTDNLFFCSGEPPCSLSKIFHLYDKQEDNQDLLSSNQENAFCGQKRF